MNALSFTDNVGVIASGKVYPVLIEEAYNSQYIAVFDPLDGSSNINVGTSTGNIFGIYKEVEEILIDDATE